MTTDLTLLGTFGAGLLSFVSPCVLPLVPPYLAFIAGASLDELESSGFDRARRRIFASAAAFVAGFSTVASIPIQSRTAAISPKGTPVCTMPNGPGFMPRKTTRRRPAP